MNFRRLSASTCFTRWLPSRMLGVSPPTGDRDKVYENTPVSQHRPKSVEYRASLWRAKMKCVVTTLTLVLTAPTTREQAHCKERGGAFLVFPQSLLAESSGR